MNILEGPSMGCRATPARAAAPRASEIRGWAVESSRITSPGRPGAGLIQKFHSGRGAPLESTSSRYPPV